MKVASPLPNAIAWVRSGYPVHAPPRGYLPLIALCGRLPDAGALRF